MQAFRHGRPGRGRPYRSRGRPRVGGPQGRGRAPWCARCARRFPGEPVRAGPSRVGCAPRRLPLVGRGAHRAHGPRDAAGRCRHGLGIRGSLEEGSRVQHAHRDGAGQSVEHGARLVRTSPLPRAGLAVLRIPCDRDGGEPAHRKADAPLLLLRARRRRAAHPRGDPRGRALLARDHRAFPGRRAGCTAACRLRSTRTGQPCGSSATSRRPSVAALPSSRPRRKRRRVRGASECFT